MLLFIILILPATVAGFYDYYGTFSQNIPDVTIHQDGDSYDGDKQPLISIESTTISPTSLGMVPPAIKTTDSTDASYDGDKQPLISIESTTISPTSIEMVPPAIKTTVSTVLTTPSTKISPSFERDSSIIPSLAPDVYYDYSSSQSKDGSAGLEDSGLEDRFYEYSPSDTLGTVNAITAGIVPATDQGLNSSHKMSFISLFEGTCCK